MWQKTNPTVINQSETSATISNLLGAWKKFLGEARTRILLWYVLLVTFILVVSIPAFRLLLYTHVDTRVRRELREKMETFKSLVAIGSTPDQMEIDTENMEEFERMRADERLKPPSSKQELKDFFRAFLSSQLPEDDSYLIAFLNGKFYRSTPRGRPEPLAEDSKLMQRWAKQTQPEQGEKEFSDPSINSIIYLTQPVKINGETIGVFVVAHTTAGERGEVLQAVVVIVQVSCVVLVVALVLAWIASGQVLAPLRVLTAATRTISESDLQQRIPVQGEGEIAELATTFNEMMDRLQAAFTSQRNFINDAGHELRTPITIIQGHLELMDNDPKEIQETRALVLDELDG